MMLHSQELSALILGAKKQSAQELNKSRAQSLLQQMLSQFEGSQSQSTVAPTVVREK